MKKIRIAAVGLGWVTLHRHLPAIRKNPRYELVGVVCRHPNRAQSVAARWHIEHWAETDDLAHVDWLDTVDALSIGTPPAAHASQIRAALLQRKHVLTEKPFVLDPVQGEELVALAAKEARILATVHNFQFMNSFLKLQADVRTGRLGPLRALTVWHASNPERGEPSWAESLPLGMFYEESPHFFYLLSRLTTSPLRFVGGEVFRSTLGRTTPDAVFARYVARNASGLEIPVALNMLFESPVSEWHLQAHGDQALVDVDIYRDIFIRLPKDGRHGALDVLRSSIHATAGHWLPHVGNALRMITGRLTYGNDAVFEHFANAIQSGSALEACGPEESLSVLRLQHEIVKLAPT